MAEIGISPIFHQQKMRIQTLANTSPPGSGEVIGYL